MKKLILGCVLALFVLNSCEENKTSSDVLWSSDKKDSIVYVNYKTDDDQFKNFYMDYLLYSMLFRQGGYVNVYNYYRQHPTEFANQGHYSTYKRSSYFSTDNSSNTPNYKSNSNSYSSPSRSNSSPIRSYSSPYRSYSSPSRSYSSPSRSYSSPSRR